jgi:hypothetical protein
MAIISRPARLWWVEGRAIDESAGRIGTSGRRSRNISPLRDQPVALVWRNVEFHLNEKAAGPRSRPPKWSESAALSGIAPPRN